MDTLFIFPVLAGQSIFLGFGRYLRPGSFAARYSLGPSFRKKIGPWSDQQSWSLLLPLSQDFFTLKMDTTNCV